MNISINTRGRKVMGVLTAFVLTATWASTAMAAPQAADTAADAAAVSAAGADRAAADGGITITNVETSGNFGDKFSVNKPINIKINYEGKAVPVGAKFGVQLGSGLKLPDGFKPVPLKATALSGEEKVIGECTAAGGAFTCTVTEDPKTTLGGNGDLKNGYVKLEAVLDQSSVGKTETDIVVDGVTHKVSLGKGVVGEPVTLENGKFCSSSGMDGDAYKYWCWIQAKASGGTEIVITENRADAAWKTGVSCVHAEATADWTQVIEKPKSKKDGQKLTFTVPDGGDWVCRVGVSVSTSEKTMTNEASINSATVSDTAKWRQRGSSGADTDEDVKPTPTPTPTPEPTPTPTPEQPKPPAPDTEQPPAPTPTPTPEPTPTPTPEQPKPPAPDTEQPPAPAPTPDPTPTPTPTPDKPKPTPEPSNPPAPEQPKPSATPTPEQPKPTPEPSQPPAPEQPKPPAPAPTPEPSTPPTPTPDKPKPTPEPSNPPAPEQPKPSATPTPEQPKPGNGRTNVPSKPSYDAPKSHLAHTGMSADIAVGAAALATAGGVILFARKRRQD